MRDDTSAKNPFGLPDGVGPHEGREFDLMRAGQKHVALFFEIAPPGLLDILADGFHLRQFVQTSGRGRPYPVQCPVWIIYRSGHDQAMRRLEAIVSHPRPGIDPAQEHEIGAILSYTRPQVDAYLRHVKQLSQPNQTQRPLNAP